MTFYDVIINTLMCHMRNKCICNYAQVGQAIILLPAFYVVYKGVTLLDISFRIIFINCIIIFSRICRWSSNSKTILNSAMISSRAKSIRHPAPDMELARGPCDNDVIIMYGTQREFALYHF